MIRTKFKKTRRVQGGIYIPKGMSITDPDIEFNVLLGNGLCLLSDEMWCIDQDVEIGGLSNYKQLIGYCLSLDKLKKLWRVKDTGFKGCKDIIASGRYEDGFEASLKPFLKIFFK